MKATREHAGFTLIIFLVVLMGLGGAALTGYSQAILRQVEKNRHEHDARVLQQAKQALLMYAYNYPTIAARGPGRLPCPDTSNDGSPNPSFNCINGTGMIGRFPVNAPGITIDATDASDEVIWYAVSSSFANTGPVVVNSDSVGTITLVDQVGNVVYDGAVDGIAAVLIAPGAIINRDEDNNGTYEYAQVRNTAAQRQDPRNYLDTFNGFDNAIFNNAESDTNDDGFILGPVFDPAQNSVVVNDQIVVITADELRSMAEKATLDVYRTALQAYQQDIWGGAIANYRFPWLDGYASITDLTIYDVPTVDSVGRVPFFNFFEDLDSQTMVGDLDLAFDIDLNLTDTAAAFSTVANPGYINQFLQGVNNVTVTGSNYSSLRAQYDGTNPNNSTDDLGSFLSNAGTPTVINETVYFWDGCPTCFENADGWELCSVQNGSETGCAMDGLGNPVAFTDWINHADIKIRFITLRFTIDADFRIGLNYDDLLAPPVLGAPSLPDAANHSRRSYALNPAAITDLEFDFNSAINDLDDFINVAIIACEQDDFVGNNYNIPSSTPDGASVDCFDVGNAYYDANEAIQLNTAQVINQFDITMDYFPPLPSWVHLNQWNDSIMMVYAADFSPVGTANCTAEDGDIATGAADDCLVITNLGAINNNIQALLVLAGEHALEDGDDLNDDGDYVDLDEVAPDNSFIDELHDIFEPENYSGIRVGGAVPFADPDPGSDTGFALVFDKREDLVNARADKFLIIAP